MSDGFDRAARAAEQTLKPTRKLLAELMQSEALAAGDFYVQKRALADAALAGSDRAGTVPVSELLTMLGSAERAHPEATRIRSTGCHHEDSLDQAVGDLVGQHGLRGLFAQTAYAFVIDHGISENDAIEKLRA